MEIKQIACVLSLFFLLSCSFQSKEEKLESLARSAFHEFSLWEDARMMNSIDFEGPVIKKKIDSFRVDTNVVIYGWYYIHKAATFWVYCKVDKSGEKKPSMHSSANYDTLGLQWEAWVNDR